MSFSPINADANTAFDHLRPLAGDPVLRDKSLRNLFWRTGMECMERQRDGGGLNRTEATLALVCDLMEYVNRDGLWLWLSYNANRAAVSAIVETLLALGADGMAGHMKRAIHFILGPPETWPAAGWNRFIKKRERFLKASSPFGDGPYLMATVELAETGLTRKQWADFYFACVKEFGETGDCPRYRKWFAANARVEPSEKRGILAGMASLLSRGNKLAPDADGLVPASDICLILNPKTGECYYCDSPDFFYDAWDMGYYYWEPELEANCYAFVHKHRYDIRFGG